MLVMPLVVITFPRMRLMLPGSRHYSWSVRVVLMWMLDMGCLIQEVTAFIKRVGTIIIHMLVNTSVWIRVVRVGVMRNMVVFSVTAMPI